MDTNFKIVPTITADVDVAHGSKSGLPNRSFLVPPLPWLKKEKKDDTDILQSTKAHMQKDEQRDKDC